MAMQMKDFSKEFVLRTKAIIESKETAKATEYEVTLLLNCLLGLIVVATEATELSETDFIDECVRKLKSMGVILKSENDKKTFRALKNALSHTHIKIGNENGVITKIQFEDKLNGVSHTKLEFSVKQLEDFALFVANQHLNRKKS